MKLRRVFERIALWASRAIEVDEGFTKHGDGYVFDAAWFGGRHALTASEATSLRYALYLSNLLAWFVSVPLFLLLVLVLATGLPSAISVAPLRVLLLAVVLGAIVSGGFILKYLLMYVVLRGKPEIPADGA